jgi:hypothetical protein
MPHLIGGKFFTDVKEVFDFHTLRFN